MNKYDSIRDLVKNATPEQKLSIIRVETSSHITASIAVMHYISSAIDQGLFQELSVNDKQLLLALSQHINAIHDIIMGATAPDLGD